MKKYAYYNKKLCVTVLHSKCNCRPVLLVDHEVRELRVNTQKA